MSAELFEQSSLQTQELEKNKQKITFMVSPERLNEGTRFAYNKTKAKYDVPGFRKGKAPKQILEMQYGKELFFPDAADHLLDTAYESVITASGLDVVGRPSCDIESISQEDGVVFTIEVYTKPAATVGAYKGLTYDAVDAEPTDEEIDKQITDARERNARLVSVTDRPAQLEDIITIDYQGSIDGELFDGGAGEDYELTLGSNTFIEGFENQLVGATTGEEREVHVTFPESYHASDLAGKPAVFQCTVKEVRHKELPELNDDFAQDVSEFDTFDEYRSSIAQSIKAEKEKAAVHEKESRIIEKLIAVTEVDIPEVMIEQQMEQLASDFRARIESNGMPFRYYLQYTGQTMDQVREGMRENATEQVRGRLALEAVADKEGIDITDEELEAEYVRVSEIYKMELDALKKLFNEREHKNLVTDLRVQKAIELVVSAAVENA